MFYKEEREGERKRKEILRKSEEAISGEWLLAVLAARAVLDSGLIK